MTIVPIACLSSSDVLVLGNNVTSAILRHRHPHLAAINRSLAPHGEQVARLYRPLAPVAKSQRRTAIHKVVAREGPDA